MPYNVNSCFEGFIKNVINLNSDRTKIARKSRENLLANISSLSDNCELPYLYDEMHINYGSFERKTKTYELDDIDMMICLKGGWGSYTEITPSVLYTVSMSKEAPILNELCNENGILNSRKLINLFIAKLSGLNDYKKAELHRNQEALTLQLKSYEWNFDIVPCFYTTSGFYLIPDGSGNWKKTDPRIDANRINLDEANIRKFSPFAKNMREFIRLMKYWKKITWGDQVESYMFEQMMLTFVEQHGMTVDWQTNIRNCLLSLSNQIKLPVKDPKGMQGDINKLDNQTRIRLSQLAYNHYQKAQQAMQLEYLSSLKNIAPVSAIKTWHDIFGNKFKLYGENYE